jgi:polygalacturonase
MRDPLRRPLAWLGLLAGALRLAGAPLDVTAFGAPRDGSAPATAAIQAAIDAARAAGGGTVVIPPGRYRCGPLALASNLTLEIQPGAVLEFPPARLPYVWGRVQGIECLTPVPLIGGRGLENVAITGGGEITADNAAWVRLFGGPTPKSGASAGSAFGPAWNRLLALLQQRTPQPEEEYRRAAPLLRPDFVCFRDCRNVRIDGLRLVGSPFWSIHLLYSEDVSIRGAVLQTFPGAFTGGIYVDSSRDVRISDCSLDDGDDAITLKAGKDADGLRVNRPTEDVVISHCVIRRGSGAIVIGSETSGWVRRVVVSDIVCQGTQAGINLKSERGRGGGIEDVRMENLVMDDVGRAISISEYYTMQGETPAGPEPVSARTPRFRDIAVRGVTIIRARGAFDFGWNPMSISGNQPGQPVAINLAGLPERPIEHLSLRDISASGAGGLRAQDAAGLVLQNVRLAPARGPGFLFRDCPDLRLSGLFARLAAGQGPALRLDRSPRASVEGCAASAGAVLSADPASAASLRARSPGLPAETREADFWTPAQGSNG